MPESQEISPYEAIGGEAAVSALVEGFYGYMDRLPEARPIRRMHAKDLGRAKEKLFKYLSGWLGGPDLYIREYGHPRLRMRHFPVAIDKAARDQWMLCMEKALEDLPMEPRFRDALHRVLSDLATHMINRPGG